MTEATIYRLNRIPEKLHVALLELLGIQIAPPNAATTDLRFWLAAPPVEPVLLAGGETEVGTMRTASEEAIVFQTTRDFVIPPARPIAYAVKRESGVKDVGVAGGEARPKGADQLAFSSPPKVGDAFYLGFEVPLARMLLRIDVDCAPARGAGVKPEDPPLRWEVSCTDEPMAGRGRGHRRPYGRLQLRQWHHHAPAPRSARLRHALRPQGLLGLLPGRCQDRSGSTGATFSHPPEISAITGAPIGALIPAAHSSREVFETVGEGDGTPGQSSSSATSRS